LMDDLELSKGLAAREPQAMDLMVDCYHRDVYRFLRHLTRHQQEAEDLAQQTLVRAIERVPSYTGAGSFRSWILGIAYREFTTWRRKRLCLPLLGDRPDKADPFTPIAEAEALLSALARLSASTRALFLLHYVEEIPIAEIALALNIPEGTVKSRLHSARQQLRTLLKEESYVPDAC
jgi:RNA polymerase sigma-70 factor (ECF subfamily)